MEAKLDFDKFTRNDLILTGSPGDGSKFVDDPLPDDPFRCADAVPDEDRDENF